jgi:hypothetical protein
MAIYVVNSAGMREIRLLTTLWRQHWGSNIVIAPVKSLALTHYVFGAALQNLRNPPFRSFSSVDTNE